MPLSQISVSETNKQLVLQCLRENPGATVEVIADKTGRSVHWARQLLRTMANLKLVRIELDPSNNSGPNRRLYFANTNRNRAPSMVSTRGALPISQFFSQLVASDYIPAGMAQRKATQVTAEILCRLIRESWRLSVGEKPTAASNRAQWRAQLIDAVGNLRGWVELFDSILSEPTWWHNDLLIEVCNDPWVAENLSQQQCELMVAKLQELTTP